MVKSSETARYYNCNGMELAIVASITHDVNWAAYIGSTHGCQTEKETVDWVLQHGAKLSEQDARHYFNGKVYTEIFDKLPYRS